MEENLENKSAFGTAGVVLGVVGASTAFIPIINNLSFVMGVLGIILGVIGLIKNFSKGKAIAALIFGTLAIIITLNSQSSMSNSLGGNSNSGNSYASQSANNNSSTNNINKKKVYSFGEKFTFDDLEIVIGKDYTFDTVKNRYSDYNNQTVIKLPITVKNVGNETNSLNMFSYDVFGSNGIEIKTLGSYFDENIDYAGELRPGASYTKYMYIQYDGNGTYGIDFDNYSEKITVEFEIKK